MALLEVESLDAGYGDLQVLNSIDLHVNENEYVAIVGPNGAGKSTAMKAVFGLATRMDGHITFDGTNLDNEPPNEIIERGMSYVPQTGNIFPSLTVDENLQLGSYILDDDPENRRSEVFERFPVLRERLNETAGTLSGGQQQMLAVACALMLDPQLLMLDEPSAGLAPDLVEEMFNRIDRVNDSGTAVLVVEQNAKETLQRCDRGYVLAQGENRYADEGKALLNDEEVRQQFLGG